MAALQPFLADLHRTHPELLRVTVGPDYLLLAGADGQGPGLPVDWLSHPDQLSVLVADGAHEAAIEALWRAGESTCWPECPDHPGTHPLQVRPSDDGPVWVCATAPRVFDRVGLLGLEPGRSMPIPQWTND